MTTNLGDISTNPAALLGLISVYVSSLAFVVAGILFVVQGWRVHWGWGLANLFIPPCAIAFSILYPKEAAKPLIVLGIGLALFFGVHYVFNFRAA
jgi:hypothetical protein